MQQSPSAPEQYHFKISVSTKVGGAILLCLAIILALVFRFIISWQTRQIFDEEATGFQTLAAAYGRAIQVIMRSGDATDVRDFLHSKGAGVPSSSSRRDHGRLLVTVATPAKKIVWDSLAENEGRPFEGTALNALQEKDGYYSLTTPVLADASCVRCHNGKSGDLRGYLLLRTSSAERDERIAETRGRLYLYAAVLALLAWLASVLVVRSVVIRPLARISARAEKVSGGDLSLPSMVYSSRDEIGQLATSFTAMLANLRRLVRQIAQTTVQLNSAATEYEATAVQQERGAVEQASAVEENRRTTTSLLDSARQVADSAQVVLQNAERTQGNNQLLSDRIATLSSHNQRISEILQVIKDIANKSDLLALNAALEGTKAGEAGRGFSLVANQMQRLAESVMASVRDIKELTDTITGDTRSAVLATEESIKLATDTTRSARQIVMAIHQQQSGMEQVSQAMEDVAKVAQESAAGSRQIATATRDLVQLSEKLQEMMRQFRTDDGPTAGGASPATRPV